MFRWLKRVWTLYRYGLSHNTFPLHAYGLFGERKPKRAEDVHCPVCGYYCLGKGGMGCIDKPWMVENEKGHSAGE